MILEDARQNLKVGCLLIMRLLLDPSVMSNATNAGATLPAPRTIRGVLVAHRYQLQAAV
jgi:hypothetical protein